MADRPTSNNSAPTDIHDIPGTSQPGRDMPSQSFIILRKSRKRKYDDPEDHCCTMKKCSYRANVINIGTIEKLRGEYNASRDEAKGNAYLRKYISHSRVKNAHGKRRNSTYRYYVPNGGEEYAEVCQRAFMKIFNIKSDRTIRNARDYSDSLNLMPNLISLAHQRISLHTLAESRQPNAPAQVTCSCPNSKPITFASAASETLEQFKKVTNWSRFRLQGDTLNVLFNEGYNSIIALQVLMEQDLMTLGQKHTINMGQLSLLRSFVQSLHCEQHPPDQLHVHEEEKAESDTDSAEPGDDDILQEREDESALQGMESEDEDILQYPSAPDATSTHQSKDMLLGNDSNPETGTFCGVAPATTSKLHHVPESSRCQCGTCGKTFTTAQEAAECGQTHLSMLETPQVRQGLREDPVTGKSELPILSPAGVKQVLGGSPAPDSTPQRPVEQRTNVSVNRGKPSAYNGLTDRNSPRSDNLMMMPPPLPPAAVTTTYYTKSSQSAIISGNASVCIQSSQNTLLNGTTAENHHLTHMGMTHFTSVPVVHTSSLPSPDIFGVSENNVREKPSAYNVLTFGRNSPRIDNSITMPPPQPPATFNRLQPAIISGNASLSDHSLQNTLLNSATVENLHLSHEGMVNHTNVPAVDPSSSA
ncbi:uncharacterized protein [Amphiura filiformis]|uniref:uncharacterized protein isoform X2 n=1 Tax=Amphiura filiformis TaxID=82378 RepID=UPI003B221FE9